MMVLLSIAHLATIVASVAVGVYILRGRVFTLAGLAVVTILAATLMWSLLSLVAAQTPYSAGSDYPVRILFWTALLVAGIRSLVKVLEHPTWSPSPIDIIKLTAHPLALGVIAAAPLLHSVVVKVDSEGDLFYAWGFWVHAVVTLVLSVRPVVRLVDGRGQLPVNTVVARVWVTAAWLLPAGGFVVSTFVWGPAGPSLAPAFLLVPIGLLGSAVVGEGLVDRVPLGRGEVFENMSGAVFVTDNLGRVIDANAAARDLARDMDGVEDVTGHTLRSAAPHVAEILERGGEVDLPGVNGDRILSILTSPIVDSRATSVGRCAIVRDVTESATQRRELERVRDALADQVAVSEKLRLELGAQVVHDSATGAYNRRYLAEALPGIVESCVAQDVALSIVVFDIDDFKVINDSHGHVAGDRVIEAVAITLRDMAKMGTVVRYGGDEFLALLPGVSGDDALKIAEAMRAACADLSVQTRNGEVQVTVSAGVSTLVGGNIDADELLEVADRALYRAKAGGRNQTWSQVDGAA